MSNSEIPDFCNLNPDWFEREPGEKVFYFMDDNFNPRVSKFKKNKENITYNLENKRRTFKIEPKKGKKSKKFKIRKIFKNLKKSLKKRVDSSIIDNIVDDFGANKINLKNLDSSTRKMMTKKYCNRSSNKNTKKKKRSLFDYLPRLRQSQSNRRLVQKESEPKVQVQQNNRNNQRKDRN